MSVLHYLEFEFKEFFNVINIEGIDSDNIEKFVTFIDNKYGYSTNLSKLESESLSNEEILITIYNREHMPRTKQSLFGLWLLITIN